MSRPYIHEKGGAITVAEDNFNIEVTVGHDSQSQYFNISLFLVLCNRVAAVVFGCTMSFVNGEKPRDRPSVWKYLAIAAPTVVSCLCQYEALKSVSYPSQMLGKSLRMLPAMMWGSLFAGRRHSGSDWFVALAVTAGIMQYLALGPIGSCRDPFETIWQHTTGVVMLVSYLMWDALASYLQDYLLSGYEARKQRYRQVMHINMCAAVIAVGLLFAMGDFRRALDFCAAHHMLARDALLLSVSAVAGQWCIYSHVQEFGAVFFANTMTLRQLLSTLASYAYFKHPITTLQMSGLCCIFGALIYKGIFASIETKGSASGERRPLRGRPHPQAAAGKGPEVFYLDKDDDATAEAP